MRKGPIVGITLRRISPVMGARSALAISIISSAWRKSAFARPATVVPMRVISTCRLERSATAVPSTDSRSRMPALSVDWVMWQRSAARPKCRAPVLGRPILETNCQIAAIARATNAAVETRNSADFERCGIALIDPWTNSGALP